MNCLSLGLAVVLAQAPAVPQNQARQQQQTRPQDRGSISGYVLKMGSSDPLAKAVVTITLLNGARNQSYSATTAAGGQFAFQNVEPGQYRLSATRSGFVRMEYGARTPNRAGLPITINPSQVLSN